jgi:hypothetical protein
VSGRRCPSRHVVVSDSQGQRLAMGRTASRALHSYSQPRNTPRLSLTRSGDLGRLRIGPVDDLWRSVRLERVYRQGRLLWSSRGIGQSLRQLHHLLSADRLVSEEADSSTRHCKASV